MRHCFRSMGLRVAVIGLGSIGQRHLRILRALERELDLTVLGVSRRADVRKELAEGGARVEASLEAVAPIDVAVIATETGRHPFDVTALSRTPTVLVEKPLASSVAALANVEWPAQVFVGYNLRFTRGMSALRDALESIGPIYAARAEARSYLPDWRPGRDYRISYGAGPEGGVMLDLSHEIDGARWLFGDVASPIRARLVHSGRLEIEREDLASLSWPSASGAEVAVELDYLSKPTFRQVRAHGANGTAVWDLVAQTLRVDLGGASEVIPLDDGDRDASYREQAVALISAARGGPTDPRLATRADGIAVLMIADEARRNGQKLP